MRVAELIERLQTLLVAHGDQDVVTSDGDTINKADYFMEDGSHGVILAIGTEWLGDSG